MTTESPTSNESSERDALLTYQEVQAEFAIAKGTLFCWVHKRLIPHVRLGPRTVRFRRRELRRWLDQRAVAVALTPPSSTP